MHQGAQAGESHRAAAMRPYTVANMRPLLRLLAGAAVNFREGNLQFLQFAKQGAFVHPQLTRRSQAVVTVAAQGGNDVRRLAAALGLGISGRWRHS
jgi:hypothetical protein